jgi:hypothetical protein
MQVKLHTFLISVLYGGKLVIFMLRLGKKPQYHLNQNLMAKRKAHVLAGIELCTLELIAALLTELSQFRQLQIIENTKPKYAYS